MNILTKCILTLQVQVQDEHSIFLYKKEIDEPILCFENASLVYLIVNGLELDFSDTLILLEVPSKTQKERVLLSL